MSKGVELMPRYYKYLPWFILERLVNKLDPDFSTTFSFGGENEYEICLIEIENGLWLGTNLTELLKSKKARLERKLAVLNKELEEINKEMEDNEPLTITG
jgi:hypothetical protein